MVILHNSRRVPLHFTAPEDGGGSGGNGPSGQSQEDGKTKGEGGSAITSLFDKLPWDELDDDSKASLKKVQDAVVATLQSEAKLKTDLERQTKLTSQFQSETDKVKAELSKHQKQQQNEPDPYETALTEELKKAGYNDEQAASLAPVFSGMFKRIGVIQKKEIGADLQPMGHAVLSQQAQTAFQTAVVNDVAGIFQTPEVQQKVWDFVVERTKAGAETTPEIVANLGAMAWVEHLKAQREAGKSVELPTPRVPTTPVVPGMTPFTFPGATVVPIFSPTRDPNAARTTLDGDTLNALATTFKTMGADTGIYPKDLKSHILTPRGGRK